MAQLDNLDASWDGIENRMIMKKANGNVWSAVQRLLWAASVYYIWNERNNRLFKGTKNSVDVIVNQIISVVKGKLSGLKMTSSRNVEVMRQLWGL